MDLRFFPVLADALFYALCAFFLPLGILRYLHVASPVALTVSALFGLSAGAAALLLGCKNRRKKLLTRTQQREKQELMLHLALEKPERVRAALCTALAADGKTALAAEDGIETEGETLVPRFTMQPLSADAVAGLLQRFGAQPFTLCGNAITAEGAALLASFGRKFMGADEVCDLFRRTKTTPHPLILANVEKPTLKHRARRIFSKKNARPFFVSGILLLAMSLFVLFPRYYLITGGILLVLAVLIRFFGYS